MLPEYMGYDRTISVFSPDGRLFQVEYAKEAAKKGVTCLGIVFKDGILLATVKPLTPLMVTDSIEKISQIDDHAAAVASRLLADARVLVNQARVRAQIHKITYDEDIDIWNLSKVIADRMQISTLYAGLRPYGVIFLIGGVDKTGPHLLEVDPSGMVYEWFAHSMGRGGAIANKILSQKWKPSINERDAVALALDVISKTEKEKKENEAEIAVIRLVDRKFRKLSEEEIKKILK